MDSRLPKLCPGILVSSVAVFILLSVPTSGEEATRCYWCGPLADQVHRSQRAPSCDTFDLDVHHTVCDEGYMHCATVATSPPYAESRLCVKFYQDECYSLYCNSTNTWRMVCACRGNLCNGRLTDRETKAFAVLPRNLEKSTRTKRALIAGFNSVKTNAPADNNTIIIMNNTNTINSLQSDQLESENTTNANTMDDIPKNIEDNIIIEHGTVKTIESSITPAYVSKDETNDENIMQDTSPITPVNSMETNGDTAKDDKPTTPIVEYATATGAVNVTLIKPTTIEVEVALVHNSVPPVKLPSAEALQQNVTPTKAMELSTVPAVIVTTENNHLIETTMSVIRSNLTKENIGAQNVAHVIILLITFLIHYCV